MAYVMFAWGCRATRESYQWTYDFLAMSEFGAVGWYTALIALLLSVYQGMALFSRAVGGYRRAFAGGGDGKDQGHERHAEHAETQLQRALV